MIANLIQKLQLEFLSKQFQSISIFIIINQRIKSMSFEFESYVFTSNIETSFILNRDKMKLKLVNAAFHGA